MKKCPYCAEEIQSEAIKCKHCGSMLDGSAPDRAQGREASSGSGFSITGLLGAFLAVCGLAIGLGGAAGGHNLVALAGVALLVVGAGMGAKYK